MNHRSRRERIATQLADLKMPGALEAIDEILSGVDGGALTAGEAIERFRGSVRKPVYGALQPTVSGFRRLRWSGNFGQ